MGWGVGGDDQRCPGRSPHALFRERMGTGQGAFQGKRLACQRL